MVSDEQITQFVEQAQAQIAEIDAQFEKVAAAAKALEGQVEVNDDYKAQAQALMAEATAKAQAEGQAAAQRQSQLNDETNASAGHAPSNAVKAQRLARRRTMI